MILASLVWGAPQWALPAGVLVACLLVVLVGAYWRAATTTPVRVVAFLLKTTGVLCLAWCLIDPLYSGLRPRPKANLFLVLADNSRSLGIRDQGSRQSRAQRMGKALDQQASWSKRLDQDFDVRRYVFDERLRAVGDYKDLAYDGNASLLGNALGTLGQRFQGRPIAGVLLFTDGNATDTVASMGNNRLPRIYPVVQGADRAARDIALRRIAVSQTNFEATPVTIRAEVVSTGYAGRTLVAELLDADDKVVDAIKTQGLADGKLMEFRFRLRPEQSGVSFYRVRVAADDQRDQWENPQQTAEATLANNQRTAVVDRGGGPYRVLYVSGRPNWEFKFLRRALAEDIEVELVGLVRIARKKPKFEFRSRDADSRNQLYKGFDNKSEEEAEQYHEPVLMRIGTTDEFELRGGFPKTADQLFRYHALIFDDVEAAFLTPDQMSLVRTFVSQRGGGFLMLGGQESFQKGGYSQTPVGEILPVYLHSESAAQPTKGHRLLLTRDGWLQPWMRLRATETEERKRMTSMPLFRTINRVSAIKPGASELLQAEDDAGHRVPALVAQRFGKGRTAAFLIGDYWRWDLHRPESKNSDLGRAWRQVVRWLVSDVPRRVELEARRNSAKMGRTVELRVRVADEEYKPLDNARVKVTVHDPQDQTIALTTEASPDEAGLHTTRYWPRRPGAYRVTVEVTGSDGSEIGSREVGWVSEPAADEFRNLTPNRELLQRIADESGGEVLALDQLNHFVADLPNRKVPITEHWVYPLWHQWWVICLAVLCLCGEWGLRRWKGLP